MSRASTEKKPKIGGFDYLYLVAYTTRGRNTGTEVKNINVVGQNEDAGPVRSDVK